MWQKQITKTVKKVAKFHQPQFCIKSGWYPKFWHTFHFQKFLKPQAFHQKKIQQLYYNERINFLNKFIKSTETLKRFLNAIP